ncbi:MAG TPA: hypothetical protein VF909_07120 [Roseiflexaceae bacterium]
MNTAEAQLGATDRQFDAIQARLADLDDNDTLLAEHIAALGEERRDEAEV